MSSELQPKATHIHHLAKVIFHNTLAARELRSQAQTASVSSESGQVQQVIQLTERAATHEWVAQRGIEEATGKKVEPRISLEQVLYAKGS